jgi:hypothetical protein
MISKERSRVENDNEWCLNFYKVLSVMKLNA